MKKTVILICTLLVALIASSQKQSFCTALPILENSATNEFSDLRKEIDTEIIYPESYFSSLQIEKSTSCKVVKFMGSYVYEANFGTFGSLDEARKVVSDFSEALRKCYSGIKTSVSTENTFKIEYHTLSNHFDNGFRVYNARFEIKPFRNGNRLTFKFNASEEEDDILNTNPSKAYYDYAFVNSELAFDDFSLALRKVIGEAKSAFKSIKGEGADFGSIFPSYKTTYKIPGFNCFIEERSANVIFYNIPEFQKGSAEEFPEAFAKAKSKIEMALGLRYGVTPSSDGKQLVYVHKDHPEKPVVKLYLIESNNGFSLELSVSNLE